MCLQTIFQKIKQGVVFMSNSKKLSIRAMVYMAFVAAIYAAITLSTIAISYQAVQFRIAESLNLLAFFNPKFIPAVTLGVFLSNLLGSPLGVFDVVFGTLATLIALLLVHATKKATNNLLAASIWPTIINALMIPLVILFAAGGIEAITWEAFLPFMGSVAFGQFVVVNLFGYTVFRILMRYHNNFIQTLKTL